MATPEEARIQFDHFMRVLTNRLQEDRPSWCKQQYISDEGNISQVHLCILGHFIDARNNQLPCWWKVECKIDKEKELWYYALTTTDFQVPLNKKEDATRITATKYYDAQSVLDALASFYPPLLPLTTLINIHERVKQLESLYQTRQARVP